MIHRVGTAEQPRFEPGTELDGRFRLETLLGKGGHGEVYRGTQLSTQRVKLICRDSERV